MILNNIQKKYIENKFLKIIIISYYKEKEYFFKEVACGYNKMVHLPIKSIYYVCLLFLNKFCTYSRNSSKSFWDLVGLNDFFYRAFFNTLFSYVPYVGIGTDSNTFVWFCGGKAIPIDYFWLIEVLVMPYTTFLLTPTRINFFLPSLLFV